MRSGLDALLASQDLLDRHVRGRRVGVCCNHTAVTAELQHILPALRGQGAAIARVFGPEHGVDATAQDMIGVADGETDAPTADLPSTVSLYG